MMEQQTGMVRDWGEQNRDWREQSQEMRRTAAQERHKSERLAQQLSQEARQQLQRSLEGLLAFPMATALGIASGTLYISAFIERGFEIFQQSAEAMRGGIEQTRREFQTETREGRPEQRGEARGEEERAGDGGRYRAEQQRGEAHA